MVGLGLGLVNKDQKEIKGTTKPLMAIQLKVGIKPSVVTIVNSRDAF